MHPGYPPCRLPIYLAGDRPTCLHACLRSYLHTCLPLPTCLPTYPPSYPTSRLDFPSTSCVYTCLRVHMHVATKGFVHAICVYDCVTWCASISTYADACLCVCSICLWHHSALAHVELVQECPMETNNRCGGIHTCASVCTCTCVCVKRYTHTAAT